MEKNNFPKGKGADEGVERSRNRAALSNQVLRTASDEDSLVTRKGQKGHQFHAVVSIPLIFHRNDALVLTLYPEGLAEVSTEPCVLDYHL